jgi:pantoate--beta-alanine ligase
MVNAGKIETGEIINEMKKVLGQKSSIEIEYISVIDPDTLEAIDRITGKTLAAVAVRIGPARLIDNILIDIKK